MSETMQNQMSNKRQTKGTLFYSLIIFVAGSSYGFMVPVIKIAAGMNIFPSSFICLQYIIAFLVCAAVICIKHIKIPSFKKLAHLSLLGIMTGCSTIFYYTSITLLPSSVALTLLFQYVWIDVLLNAIITRKFPKPSSIVAVAVVVLGTLFASGVFEGEAQNLNPIGVASGFIAAFFYALFLRYSGKIEIEEPTFIRTAMQMVGALIVTSIYNPKFYVTSLFDFRVYPFAILLSILGLLISGFLINYASPNLSPEIVPIMASSELPIGILMAWAIAGDAPTAYALVGSIFVLVGIFIKQAPAVIRKLKA